jgi:hypothetical protein
MNIDDMQAGQEMDRLVAEATGWARWQTVNGRNAFPVATDTLHDEWQPSTNIAHAFEVLARLSELDGHWLAMMWDQGASWAVELEAQREGFKDVGRTVAETLPLAICRASLKAVRG